MTTVKTKGWLLDLSTCPLCCLLSVPVIREPAMENPAVLALTDRNELNDQPLRRRIEKGSEHAFLASSKPTFVTDRFGSVFRIRLVRQQPFKVLVWMGFQIRVILGVPQKWAYIMQMQMFPFSSWLTLFCFINTIARGDRHEERF